jgi:hypothetical protein
LLNNKKAIIAIKQHKKNFQSQIETALAKIGIKGFTIKIIT